jgi:hypothetical protein
MVALSSSEHSFAIRSGRFRIVGDMGRAPSRESTLSDGLLGSKT